MPRLPHALLRRARQLDQHLPALVLTCRDLASARNELRWLQEHAARICGPRRARRRRLLLRGMVWQRGAGRPLQYILGSEYFGELEMACEPGVLIPRQETAASVTHLVEQLKLHAHLLPADLRVLDLCTGTGCIPLLFEHLLRNSDDGDDAAPDLRLLGVDVSEKCVSLADRNKERCLGASKTQFVRADVLAEEDGDDAEEPAPSAAVPLMAHLRRREEEGMLRWDILTSNPPYISPDAFVRTTKRSVRNFEPKLALVPPPSGPAEGDSGDVFYPRLLDIADRVRARIVLFEAADMEQALRIAAMARGKGSWLGMEVWRDEPGARSVSGAGMVEEVNGIRILGRGNGRSVVCWRGEGARWLGRAI